MRIRPALRRACAASVFALAAALGMAPNALSQSLVEALSSTYNSNPDLLAGRAILRHTDETLAQAVANWRVRFPEFPRFVRPMKATAVTQLPEDDGWIYEIKWDGYRVVAAKAGEEVRLLSLKEKNLTADFPAVADAVRGLGVERALIDGEVVAMETT